MTGDYSHDYEEQGEGGELVDYTRVEPSVAWVGGGMVSNLYDLKVWVKALAEGELISDKMHKEQLNFVDMPGGEAVNLKYGLCVYSFDGFIGHSGKIFGFNCAAYYLPEEQATLIAITNKSIGEAQEAGIMFMGLANVLFEGKFPGL